MQTHWLRNARLRVAVAPALGGSLARLDAWHDGGWQPLLRPMSEEIEAALAETDADPIRDAACYPLLPWSNRIGGGGFHFDGRFRPIPRNRDDEPWPIHGTGWQRVWQVTVQREDRLQLRLLDVGGNPYRYAAWQQLWLHDGTLEIELGVRNLGAEPLPFGLGLHPFFVRDADTRLRAAAHAQWRAREDGRLPDQQHPLSAEADFTVARRLPPVCIDHAFEGWDGRAQIQWPQRGLSLSLTSDCRRFVLYTPPDAAFFCFEPVDHPIDAPNLHGGAAAHGMTVLAPEQALVRSTSLSVQAD